MKTTHQWNRASAIVRVEGLKQSVRTLHIADVHLGLIDERDAEHLDICKNLGERFHPRHDNRDAQGDIIPQETAFRQMLEMAREERVDLLSLTGDIVDFPARANVEYARRVVDKSGLPALYTAGNHDWHFLSCEPTPATRRAFLDALAPLYAPAPEAANSKNSATPAFAQLEIGEVLFVAVDNSTYQVEEDQLELTLSALARGLPTVLLIHIPLSLPTLRTPVMEHKNGTPVLMADPDWPLADRRNYGTAEDTPTTLEFARLISGAQNLVAILCGHVHFDHVDALNLWAAQYVVGPGYAGEYRLVEFQPLQPHGGADQIPTSTGR